MDNLQYTIQSGGEGDDQFSFKPYYKWIIFNIEHYQ